MSFWTELKLSIYERGKLMLMGAAVGFVFGAVYGLVLHDLLVLLVHHVWRLK